MLRFQRKKKMSGLGLESLMEGWSLNEGSGSLKKGSSMNAMRSARGDMGTAGGKLGGGIKSSVGGRFSFPKVFFFLRWTRRRVSNFTREACHSRYEYIPVLRITRVPPLLGAATQKKKQVFYVL